jgi:phosphate acetyltransferase
MALIEELQARAARAGKKIVLPEGQDARVLQAAQIIAERGIADVTVLATADDVAAHPEIDLGNPRIEVLDFEKSELRQSLADSFHARRAHKGVTPEQALQQMGDRLYFGNMLLASGAVDGLVAGSIASTPDMLRASFQCLGTADGIKTGSSCFVMELDRPAPAGDKVLFYADCGVNPEPTPEQLCDIAVATAQTYKSLMGAQPRVAFLSFSTGGSASHPLVERTRQAVEITRRHIAEQGLDIVLDGELQADAALVPTVANSKCPQSPVAGRANILIFPDLQAGNIAYKLTERLAGAAAYGPILQGLAKPVNDLSRGCSVDDIVGVAAVTVCQSV